MRYSIVTYDVRSNFRLKDRLQKFFLRYVTFILIASRTFNV